MNVLLRFHEPLKFGGISLVCDGAEKLFSCCPLFV